MARRNRRKRRRTGLLAVVGIGAAAAQYFFDPVLGRTRRTQTKDRIAGMARRPAKKLSDEAAKKSQLLRDRAEGAAHELTRTEADEWPENDAVLVDKIRSEVLGGPEWSPYTINVNAARGVVALRGQGDRPEQIAELEERVRDVPGVREVQSLLHLPGTEPPNVQDALSASRAGQHGVSS
jgi:hypothetical protein